jgi:predicted DNA binding protein
MVLTQYRPDRRVRLSVRGTPDQLEPIGLVLERLFPGEVIVTSDEDSDDELTEDQLEVLEAIYERGLEERYAWPAPSL